MLSSVCRQRESLVTMDSTVAVQTKGFGFSFHAARNSAIACFSSETLLNEPRRMRLLVNSPNQRSTRFSQLELVGSGRQSAGGASAKRGRWDACAYRNCPAPDASR